MQSDLSFDCIKYINKKILSSEKSMISQKSEFKKTQFQKKTQFKKNHNFTKFTNLQVGNFIMGVINSFFLSR